MTQIVKECHICRGKGQIQRIVGREIKIDICSYCGGRGSVYDEEYAARPPSSNALRMTAIPTLFDDIMAFPIVDESEVTTESPIEQKMETVMEQKMQTVITTVDQIKEEETIKGPVELENKYKELIDQLKQYIASTKDLDSLLNTIENCETLAQIKKTVGYLQRWQTFSLQVVLWMQKTEKTWDKISGGGETPLRSEWIQLKRQLLQRLDTKKEQIEALIGERSATIIDTSIANFVQNMTPESEASVEDLAKSIGGEIITIEKRLLYLLYNKDMKAMYDSVSRKITKM